MRPPTVSLFSRSLIPAMAGLKKNTRRMAKRMKILRRMSHIRGRPQVMFLNPSR